MGTGSLQGVIGFQRFSADIILQCRKKLLVSLGTGVIKELGKLKPMGGALIAFGNDELHNSCGNCSQCSKKCGDAGEKRDRLRIHKNTSFLPQV